MPKKTKGIEFDPGTLQIGKVTLTVSPAGLVSQIILALVGSRDTSQTVYNFTSDGVEQTLDIPIYMPNRKGTYEVYLQIDAETILLGVFQGIDNIYIN